MLKNDDTLIENIRQVLDQSLADLDATTRSRLTQARSQAIERQRTLKSRLFYWGSVPAAGLLLLALMLIWPSAPLQPVVAPVFNELSILTAAEPLEFYQEEMEFYEWLSEVLETEKELSEYSSSQSAFADGERLVGAGEYCFGAAEYRNARLSWLI